MVWGDKRSTLGGRVCVVRVLVRVYCRLPGDLLSVGTDFKRPELQVPEFVTQIIVKYRILCIDHWFGLSLFFSTQATLFP